MESLREKVQLAAEVALEIYEEVIDQLPDLLGEVPQEVYDGCLLLIGQRLSAHAVADAIINADMNAAILIHKMSSDQVMEMAHEMVAESVISKAMGGEHE